jgi:hypothetical protein
LSGAGHDLLSERPHELARLLSSHPFRGAIQ